LHWRLIVNVARKDTRRTVPFFLLDRQVAHLPYQPLLLHLKQALVLDLVLNVLLLQIHVLRHLIMHELLWVCCQLVLLMYVFRLCHFILFKTTLATWCRRRIVLLLAVSIPSRESLRPATSIDIWCCIFKQLAILGSLFRTLHSVG
jgi:hypothetical protein